jgi:hypothetical protein
MAFGALLDTPDEFLIAETKKLRLRKICAPQLRQQSLNYERKKKKPRPELRTVFANGLVLCRLSTLTPSALARP